MIDLRSDVHAPPTDEMWEAMRRAELGWASVGEDASVNELCGRVAVMDGGKIVALDSPDALIQALLDRGFHKERVERQANLEDVFIDLTGHELREDE